MLEAREVFRLDRARLRASFERASAGYESAAGLQARVAAELLERLAGSTSSRGWCSTSAPAPAASRAN